MRRSEIDHIVTIGTTSILRDSCLERLLDLIKRSDFQGRAIVADQNDRENLSFYDDYNVEVLQLKFDAGLSKARNSVIEKVDTPYFLWLDDDIGFNAEGFSKLVSCLQDHREFGWISPVLYEVQEGMIKSHAANWEADGRMLIRHEVKGDGLIEVDQPSAVGLYRMEVFDKLQFLESIKIGREHLLFAWEFSQTKWKGGVDFSSVFSHGSCFSAPEYKELRSREEHADQIVEDKLGFTEVISKRESTTPPQGTGLGRRLV